MRVSKDFKNWCDAIIKDKKSITNERNEQLSGQKITKLIPKHNNSEEIKIDILNFKWGKRGVSFNIFYVMAMMVIGVIALGVVAFLTTSIYSGLNQNEMIGQVNLSNATQETYGRFNDSFTSNLDLFGLFLIFGMIGGLLIASFLLRGKWDKILIIVDIFILIVAYIVAIVLSNYYESLLIASSGVLSQFEGQMPRTSNFLLHLPRYSVIIGVVSMILFYSSVPKREGEREINLEEGGY